MKSIWRAGIHSSPRRLLEMSSSAGGKMKTAKAVLASSVFLGMAFGTAHAEICYQIAPFIDVIRVAQTTFQDEAAGGTHTLVVGNWAAGGFYSLPVVGSLDVSVNPGGIRVGLHATNHTALGGNHSDCTLDQLIPGPAGSLQGSCDGRVPGIFVGPPATLTVISCDTLSTAPVVGKTYFPTP